VIPIDAAATDSDFASPAAVDALSTTAGRSRRRGAVRRMLRRPSVWLALAFLALVLVCALFGHWLEPYNPNAVDVLHRNAPPSRAHWLGTDDLGRDILSRIIAGAKIALRVSVQSVGVAIVLAIPIGLFAAYAGGWIDNVIMRFADAMMSFPALVLALAIAGILGPSLGHAAIAISLTMLPGFVRLVRGSALAVKHETFIEASRSIGVSTRRILLLRILPNIRSPLIVAVSLALGGALLAEAGLSFLGLSVQPPAASWGSMLRHAYDVSLFTYPWQLVIPGAAIALTILAFNTVGDALRDVLSPAETSTRRERGTARGMKDRRGLTTVVSASNPPEAKSTTGDALLAVEGLTVQFSVPQGTVTVVDDVAFSVGPREVLGIVGESGSGKTVTSLAVMRLLQSPPARIVAGSVRFDGQDLLQLGLDQMRRLRGGSLAMVFQDPMSSLNPAFTVRDQLVEAYRLHRRVDRGAARRRALEMLELVEIPAAAQRLADYPHQLSGGMRQRVMLAMALICEPKLLIADEPTTALDATVQAQILDLLRSLQRELGLSVVFVTHDLGVVANLCDRVAVMYAGQIVEEATVHDLFVHPRHPYTEGLLRAMPQVSSARTDDLYVIDGMVPAPAAMPSGCRFHPRCSYAIPACAERPVELSSNRDGTTRCIRADELSFRGIA
jgi:peptide/nickel transport system permease protein